MKNKIIILSIAMALPCTVGSLAQSSVIVAWDAWSGATNATPTYTDGASGSASGIGGGSKIAGGIGSVDGTWGTLSGANTAGSGYMRQIQNLEYDIDFTVTATGSLTELSGFHFDGFYNNNNNPQTNWTLSVESGPITQGTVAQGSLSQLKVWESIDVDLSGLADNDLGPGGTATLRLSWSGGTANTNIKHLTAVDNVAISALGSSTGVGGDYANELAAVLNLGNLTNAPTMRDETGAVTTVSAGETKAVYFDALDYQGNETRVYAYIGIPAGASASNPVPAIVLVHGGEGTARTDWLERWTSIGWAAIAIATEGQTDVADPNGVGGKWEQHDWPGPSRPGVYEDYNEPIVDQWMYHAVADTILANSLMRSMDEVDTSNVGLMGVSWGGVITSTTIGIDDRFRFAIPAYGCGDMDNALSAWGDSLSTNEFYQKVWDPMVRFERVTTPALWLSWPTDNVFPIDRQAVSYRAVPAPRMVALVPGLRHSIPRAFKAEEGYAFAESIVFDNGQLWCEQIDITVNGSAAEVSFRSTKTLTAAELIWTTDEGLTTNRTWTQTACMLANEGNGVWTASASLPSGVTGWYINVFDGVIIASSGYQAPDASADISSYIRVNSEAWQVDDYAAPDAGDSVKMSPQSLANGAWSWTGPAGFTATGRAQTVSDLAFGNSGEYTVTFTETGTGSVSRDTFIVDVSGNSAGQMFGVDIGAVTASGSYSQNGSAYTVGGSGADIWGAADELHYGYQSLTGDGEIVARVASVENTNTWAKAGVMIRESLDANSVNASLIQRPDNQLAFQWRATTGGSSTWNKTLTGGIGSPKYVRLVRSGNAFSAYYSTSSSLGPWTQIGASQTISMGVAVYVGLAVTSHDDGTLCTAVFDNVSIQEN